MLARPKIELSDDAFNIKETGRFCTERMRESTDDLVAAYLSIGKALSELHGKLKKTTSRGDNEHVGWREAFKQTREDGRLVFPFGRVTAEKHIKVSVFFAPMAMGIKFQRCLPSSLGALLTIVDLKLSRAQIEKAIDDKAITTFSQAPDIRRLAKQIGLIKATTRKPKNKTKAETVPKRERIAAAFELLAKLGVTLDDLIAETEGR